MVIKTVKETSYDGMIKIVSEEGNTFYIRKEYLFNADFSLINPGAVFSDDNENEILDAGLAAVVELKALTYLNRAEQNRFSLTLKLKTKGYESKYINMALDYLEAKNYLSDMRFASAWLEGRRSNHYEGRSKLKAELISRGISKDIAFEAVENFFQDYDETEICKKAYKKFIEKGKTDDKLTAAMLNAGFTFKQIKYAKETVFEENI